MRKHVRRFVIIFGAIGAQFGGLAMWLAGNSIPKFIKDADGNFGTNLKWLGWHSPPQNLASAASDHWVYLFGLMLLILSLASLLGVFMWHRFAPDGENRDRQNSEAALTQITPVSRPPVRDTSLGSGLVYATTGSWDTPLIEAAMAEQNMDNFNYRKREFETAAADGVLTVWGKLRTMNLFADDHWDLIRPDFWQSNQVKWDNMILGDIARTENISLPNGTTDQYEAIMVNRAEFERRWPHA